RLIADGLIRNFAATSWGCVSRKRLLSLDGSELARIQAVFLVETALEGRSLVPSVLTTMNVRQSESRIHTNVIVWINRHAAEIKSAMWKIKSGTQR
ncbi:MAG: hypothetical protein WCJ02_12865, partial [bacterium]